MPPTEAALRAHGRVLREAFDRAIGDVPSDLRSQLALRVMREAGENGVEIVGLIALRGASPTAAEVYDTGAISTGLDFVVLRLGSDLEQLALVRTAFAGKVQELVQVALYEDRRDPTWPPCPLHPRSHPLYALGPDREGVEPTWVCPVTSATVATVGSLAR